MYMPGFPQDYKKRGAVIEHCTCKNNHVHREPFSDIERKKEVAKMYIHAGIPPGL